MSHQPAKWWDCPQYLCEVDVYIAAPGGYEIAQADDF